MYSVTARVCIVVLLTNWLALLEMCSVNKTMSIDNVASPGILRYRFIAVFRDVVS